MNDMAISPLHGPDLESALRLALVVAAAFLLRAIWQSPGAALPVKKAAFCAGIVCFFSNCALDLWLAAHGIQVSAFQRGLYHGIAIDRNMVLAAVTGSGLCVLWESVSWRMKAVLFVLCVGAMRLADRVNEHTLTIGWELSRRATITMITLFSFKLVLRDRVLLVRAIGYPVMNISVLYMLIPSLILEFSERRVFFREIAASPLTLTVLLGLSAAIIWSGISLAREGRGTTQQFDATSRFVTSGPYAYVRHPVYAASFAIAAIESLSTGSLYLLVYTLDVAILIKFIAAWEEKKLRVCFGCHYENYAKAVPAYIPRLSQRKLMNADENS